MGDRWVGGRKEEEEEEEEEEEGYVEQVGEAKQDAWGEEHQSGIWLLGR